MSLWKLSDRFSTRIVDSHGDEIGEPRSALVEDAEGAVLGVNDLCCGLDDGVEHGVQVEVRADGEYSVEELAELTWAGHVFHGRIIRAAIR